VKFTLFCSERDSFYTTFRVTISVPHFLALLSFSEKLAQAHGTLVWYYITELESIGVPVGWLKGKQLWILSKLLKCKVVMCEDAYFRK
jgi:hypothetical protein